MRLSWPKRFPSQRKRGGASHRNRGIRRRRSKLGARRLEGEKESAEAEKGVTGSAGDDREEEEGLEARSAEGRTGERARGSERPRSSLLNLTSAERLAGSKGKR